MAHLFAHGRYLRLRCRMGLSELADEYLCAVGDARRISLRPSALPASVRTVWRVHQATPPAGHTSVRFFLSSAAYARYFGLEQRQQRRPSGAPLAARPILGALESEEDSAFCWEPILVGEDADEGAVLLRCVGLGKVVDKEGYERSWRVEPVPTTSAPPPLPLPPPVLLLPQPVVLRRTIRYVRADDQGNFDPNGWVTFQFHGRSVHHLKTELAHRLDGITAICIRSGLHGRPTPLLVDLPRNEDTVDIIVLMTGTAAADELRFPNVAED